ncbi:hypothetical protein O1611_g843 [Lasiodiplodia mahajangana]|uniref:Uncharacterized protein n=1 Tax=Lasiodiplodia mahajangana TaxID=1108764 RepID=A0ACC2JZ31_9PEZI|nr:hypothetical protein O1611_g843 [Lasiodiplodia mahajangana]
MSPPVGGTLWREPSTEEAEKPVVVDGYILPPGTQVGVNIYSVHHNPTYFPELFSYQPDRWLSSDSNESGVAAFVPFSLGQRACAGKAMAYQEISLAMAKTIWQFDFQMADDCRPNKEFSLQDTFNSTHDGPSLVFRACTANE